MLSGSCPLVLLVGVERYFAGANKLLTMGDSKHLKTRPHSKTRISVVYSLSKEYASN
jgi:hypothetical protein